jgi:hypothetical protein
MKISKSFEMTISGNYQSYKFGSSLEQEYSDESDFKLTSDDLQALAVQMVSDDIKKQAEVDPDFSVVLAARSQSLLRDKLVREKTNNNKSPIR